MFDWLQFIGDFLWGFIKNVFHLIPMVFDAIGLISTSFVIAPPFLGTIMTLMLSAVVLMWVVNIL